MRFQTRIISTLFTFLAVQAAAQQELMFHQMPANLWQKNALNPAFFPEEKRFAIGLGAFSLDQYLSGDFGLQEIYLKENGKTYLDPGKVISKLDSINDFFYGQRIETISAGLKFGGWAISLGHAVRWDAAVTYPKSMVELLWQGNGPFIGQSVNISPAIHYLGWNEIGVGISRKLGPVRLGARVKYLSGFAAIESDPAHNVASVFTDPDIYQLKITTDYAFRSAAVLQSIDTSGFGYDFQTIKQKTWRAFSKNSGLAFDLGATAKIGEKITLEVSALDLGGKLNWKENANYFQSKGSWDYEGVIIPGSDLINGSDSLSFDSQLDSLNDIFKFQKTPEEFSSELPTRIYAGANFKIVKWLAVGATFFQQSGTKNELTAYGLNAQFTPLKWLTVGAMISSNSRNETNLGFNYALKIKPLQLYFASDNLLNIFRATTSPALNFRLGGSLVF